MNSASFAKLKSGVRNVAAHVWDGIWSRTFALITSGVTALAAPFYIASHNARSDRQTKATAEIMALLRDSKEVTENDTLRLDLALGYLKENKGLFEVQTDKFESLVAERRKQIAAEKGGQEEMKALKKRYDDTFAALDTAQKELAAMKDAQAKSIEDAGKLKLKIEELEKRQASANPEEKARLEAQIKQLQGDLEGVRTASENATARIRAQDEKIKDLEQTLGAKRPEIVQPDSQESISETEVTPGVSLTDDQADIARAAAETKKLLEENERLYQLLNRTLGGAWVYLGWHNGRKVLNNPSVDLDDKPTARTKKTYQLKTGINVRTLPTVESPVLFVIDPGFQIRLSEIKEANPVKDQDGIAVWGRLEDLSGRPRPAWYRRLFGG